MSGPDFNDPDRIIGTNIVIPLGPAGQGAARLENNGLLVTVEGGIAMLEEPLPGSKFETVGRTFDFYVERPVTISAVNLPNERMLKEVFYIPAILVLGLVVLMQRSRRTRLEPSPAGA